MKVLTNIQIKELDRYTIENEPISSIDLMERVARCLTRAIMARWEEQVPVIVFAGPGNNGGDALAVARMLAEHNYRVETYLFNTGAKLSPDCLKNRERIKEANGVVFTEITNQFSPPELSEQTLIVDGLFGSGLNKPLGGGFAALVKYINSSSADVVSIDMPSGLMCEDNTYNIRTHIVRAKLTLSLQMPKVVFFFPEYQEFIGEYQLLDIGLHPDGLEKSEASYFVTEEKDVTHLLKRRPRFAHKGSMGNALLIAGSYGMCGAAILAAKAAMRSGVGKLTVHTPMGNNGILQVAVPEAVLRLDTEEKHFSHPGNVDNFDAMAIGPGIGTHKDTALAFVEQIRRTQVPLILDADALNILGDHRGWIQQIPQGTILTPHPKEMDRVAGNSIESFERLSKARELAMRGHLFIILKGAWTAIITPDGLIHFNPTGNPGMATAGSGDVLSGILLALLARGYTTFDACRIGVYLHGLAGDLAADVLGEESLTASDLVDYLPKAFKKLMNKE